MTSVEIAEMTYQKIRKLNAQIMDNKRADSNKSINSWKSGNKDLYIPQNPESCRSIPASIVKHLKHDKESKNEDSDETYEEMLQKLENDVRQKISSEMA